MHSLNRTLRAALLGAALAVAASAAAQQYEVRPPSGMAHEMPKQDLDTLRAKVPGYRNQSDAEINASMGRMPPDWAWYGSPETVKDDIGVLVVAHGSGTVGDRVLQEGVTPLAQKHPTAIGFGMAMMSSHHIQEALDKLTAAGAKTIVVVPAVVTEQSSVYRQWAYLFGRRDDSAYLDVPRVKTTAKLVFAPAMDEHPLVTDILYDHAKAISADPANEVVILLGHGPTFDHENEIELRHIATHAQRIKQRGGFFDAKGLTLQDDAPAATREANVAQLRRWIETARRQGKDALIVAAVHQAKGIQQKIYSDLDGLTFRYNEKGMSNHPAFVEWVKDAVKTALADKG